MPAIRSTSTVATTIVNSRMRKPTVPAVPGSGAGTASALRARPASRASCQPSAISASAVTIRAGTSWLGPNKGVR
jgi:hypothetical protein